MKRILEIDGVRGVAILLVLVWHYFPCQLVAEPGSLASQCSRVFSLTWSGGELFFVLSGFLIAGILIDHRGASNYFRVFYLRRTCRIFPLYFLLLGLYCLIAVDGGAGVPAFQWLFQEPLPLWSYAAFTQNIFMGVQENLGANWLAPTWSLAVEEQFYLFLPLLIFFLPGRMCVVVLLAAVVAAPFLRWWFPGITALVNMPFRSDALLSGACLAFLVRWHPFISTAVRHRRWLVGIFFTFLAGAAVLTVRPLPLGGPLNHFLLAGLYSSFLLIAFLGTEPRLGRWLRTPFLVWFGQLSYGIYMFHQPVSGLLHGFIRHEAPQIRTFSDAGVTVLALGLTLLLAMLSFRFLESPILQFGHRFKYASKVEAAANFSTAGAE